MITVQPASFLAAHLFDVLLHLFLSSLKGHCSFNSFIVCVMTAMLFCFFAIAQTMVQFELCFSGSSL